MLDFNGTKIYLACGATDFRNSINGLSAKVQMDFGMSPFETGTLFVFCNKAKTGLKILEWENSGFWLYYKRLEYGTFRWPKDDEPVMELTADELALLLEGVKLAQKLSRKELRPKYAC